MHSSDKSALPPNAVQRPAVTPQHDDHVASVIESLESAPSVQLDWPRLIESGTTPCLALGAERRTRKPTDKGGG